MAATKIQPRSVATNMLFEHVFVQMLGMRQLGRDDVAHLPIEFIKLSSHCDFRETPELSDAAEDLGEQLGSIIRRTTRACCAGEIQS